MSARITKPTSIKDINREWHHFDVNGKVLGRITTEIAQKLIGKGKPYYVPYLDCGDYIVVTNAASVVVTGKKREQKTYDRYSGYPGGLKIKNYAQVQSEDPERIIREAVAGMLPKNKLRDSMLKRLFIFPKEEHPYGSKINPDKIGVKNRN